MKSNSPKLSESEQRIYDCLRPRRDVRITILYRTIYRRWPAELRNAQMAVGPYLTRLNRKLAPRGLRAAPGRERGTYRLVKT